MNPTEEKLVAVLGLQRRPVAITFCDEIPAGVPAFTGTVPSGCSFWSLASERVAFYTVPSDHYNCPIGSHTHHIALPEGRAQELPDTLNLMAEIGYVRMQEVPMIPTMPKQAAAVVYAPLSEAPLPPDAVILSGRPGKMMLLTEAAIRAGIPTGLPLLARPTCMAIPAALQTGMVTSTGCIGNRVYTGLGEDDLYVVVPGAAIDDLANALDTVASANAKLAEYHTARRSLLTS